MTRLMRRLGAGSYAELHRVSVDEPDRFWPALVDDLGIEFSRPWTSVVDSSRGPEWSTWFNGAPGERRARVPPPLGGRAARGRRGARRPLRGRRPRVAHLRRGLTAGDAARRGADGARRRRGRPGRHLHADVAGRRGRRARVRAHRRRARADLLGLRRTRDRVAARGLAGARSRSAPTGRSAAASASRCARRSTRRGRTRSST